ncbi:MAG TPA: hypothetical protein VGN19_03225 [Pedococcus sp.]|nr:hypothetical protein [Pedococcus sp.]
MLQTLTEATIRLGYSCRNAAHRRERGDVPGWVLITLMTAGLVAALWAVAEGQLTSLFSRALDSARR